MSRETSSKIPRDVAQLRRQIERWRQTRRKRSPMPEELWQEATRLAREHGVSAIARLLSIGYASLKERTERQPASRQRQACEPGHEGEFVELSAAQLFGARPGAVVELAAPDGLRLKIRLDDGGQLDVVGLLGAFCGRGRS